ncbi:F-box only protein 7-like isoform X2 [Dreissena polymorpha]|uniref:F-box only protein 7-like isoform X2 n=1 Tax=Dreissena polymorpha TaxID=45954 RepID=UPI002264C5A7|nr:F-box only protein 7-like isoform X2 [Dreissena polymorpha]
MKLRVRCKKTTRVLELNDEQTEGITVGGVIESVRHLFGDLLNGDFHLSLNGTDALCLSAKLLSDCGIVGGDLIHVIQMHHSQDPLSPGPSKQEHQNEISTSRTLDTVGSSQNKSPSQAQCSNTSSMERRDDTQGDLPLIKGQSQMDTQTAESGERSNLAQSELPSGDDCSEMEVQEEEVDLAVVWRCLSEPVLCREAVDGQVPSLLKEMYTILEPVTMSEKLAVVLHVLMLETGFIPLASQDPTVTAPPTSTWRQKGYQLFTYSYPGCGDHTCSLTLLQAGRTVMAHGKVGGGHDATRKCSLDIGCFIQDAVSDCAASYGDLAKLSRVFKDSIANPLVQDLRTAAGLVDIFGLMALTLELKLRILSTLDLRSVLQMSCVNTELYDTCCDPSIWRRLYLKDFGNRRDNSLSQNWKELYKQEFKSRKERRKLMSRTTLIAPPFWGPQYPFGGPSHWMPPLPGRGIIGGDYDLYPNFPSGLPGIPGRFGPRLPTLPQPRYDLIGPIVDPGPDPFHIPRRLGPSRGGFGVRGGFGMGRRFF